MSKSCIKCGKNVAIYHMCDQDLRDLALWCDLCFDKHPCMKEHEEDCATHVMEDNNG